MIAGWLLYCLAVSTLLAAAAAAIEATMTRRGRPARWVWALAMIGSLAIPAASYLRQRFAPDPTMSFGINELDADASERFPSRVIDAPPNRLEPLHALARHRPRAPEPLGTEHAAMLFAVACIVIAGLRVSFDSILLYRGRRNWTPEVVHGVPVLVSDDVGPAIVGLLAPKIVLPRWTFGLATEDRELMLAHEREHLRAQDGRLTTVALLAVVCMPWNPAMWYLLRRLRTAIEIDCDRRVLGAFPDVRRYGQLLIDVAQRATGSPLAIAGFSERASPLAKRIGAMTAPVRRRLSVLDVGGGGISTLALAAAFVFLPPEAPRVASYKNMEPLTARYVGDSIAQGEGVVIPAVDSGPPGRGSQDAAPTALLVGPPIIVAAARDLPAMFSVSEWGSGTGGGRKPTCPSRLRDDRDGTSLQLSVTRTGVSTVAQRGDTSWTHLQSTGYYTVSPDGRYGVSDAKEQTLRVGCGGVTYVAVAGRTITRTNLLSSLDTPNDDRARRIGAEVIALIHVKPVAVDLYPGRLNVVVGDTTILASAPDAPREVSRAIFGRARDILGRAAMPETLAVSVRRGRDVWVTMYQYNSLAK